MYLKKKKVVQGSTFKINSKTHLFVILAAVEVRLSLSLLEDILTSASFFEPSFLNGSFMDWEDEISTYIFLTSEASNENIEPSLFSWITLNMFQDRTYYKYLLSMELSTVKVGDAARHICTGGHGH